MEPNKLANLLGYSPEVQLNKKAFKPNNSFTADPVPAGNAYHLPHADEKFRPSGSVPDPVPATPANEDMDWEV